jgi:mevalonate kinase
MKSKDGIFYAKILLFGEYSIMCDSMALTVPYTHFKGELSFINEDKYTDLKFAEASNASLAEFLTHLKSLKARNELLFDIDLQQLESDIKEGLYFESTIPQGFGIGSSGALVAAIYEKYAINRIKQNGNLTREAFGKLKKIFSQMESFFHGVSSGMDPLNSYMRNPLLIKPDHHIEPVGIPREFPKSGGIFLINTGTPGKTGPLVSLFFDKCKQENFAKLVKDEMIPYTNKSIEAILNGEFLEFFKNLKLLSKFLLQHLKPMIPSAFLDIWQAGIDTGNYYLKLCGSGGGGFLLGFAENLEKAKEHFDKQNIEIIPVSKFH